MKYKEFCACIKTKIKNVYLGPYFTITLSTINNCIVENKYINNSNRYIVFPIKIKGKNISHLNVLLLDNKKKIIERYEPFDYFKSNKINDIIEPILYKLMNEKKIYFLSYKMNNSKFINDDKNCGYYCLRYLLENVKFT